MTTTTPAADADRADTVTQTVTLACGHRHAYPNISRAVAESGFAAPGIAWFCDTCDPTHHTRRPIITVHNEPTAGTAEGATESGAAMTTHADFYDGRGPQAAWLGSLQGDADPATVFATPPGRLALTATDPITYADAVTDLLDVWADEDLGHGYHPADGWPWPWPDSGHTDWIYAFDHGRVWITTAHPGHQTGPRPQRARMR